MIRTRLCTTLIIGSLVLLLGGAFAWANLSLNVGSALAEELPPRPPADPNPPPEDSSDGDRSDRVTPVPTGRITGTVIDMATGAPAANITVSVGGVLVKTNMFGNYDRQGLRAGRYGVVLILQDWEGVPVQKPVLLELEQDETLVQHLYFYGR